MPINQADAQAVLAAVLAAHDEDYDQIGKLMTEFRSRFAALDWMAALTTEATTRFEGTGLSTDWWIAEVDRRSS